MAVVRITPKQLAAKWKTIPNKFETNVFNFETLIGGLAVKTFKESFYLNKFNSVGQTPWEARTSHRNYPLLRESLSLYNSIKVKKKTPKHKVVIYTDDSEFISSARQFTDPHKYGARPNKNRDYAFCYAAIHNAGGSGGDNSDADKMPRPVTGKAAFIKQRKFIGHSSVLAERIDFYSFKLFDGFPQ